MYNKIINITYELYANILRLSICNYKLLLNYCKIFKQL